MERCSPGRMSNKKATLIETNMHQKQHCKQLHAYKLYDYREDYAVNAMLWISLRGPEKQRKTARMIREEFISDKKLQTVKRKKNNQHF